MNFMFLQLFILNAIQIINKSLTNSFCIYKNKLYKTENLHLGFLAGLRTGITQTLYP
jgi:hypothetical protein